MACDDVYVRIILLLLVFLFGVMFIKQAVFIALRPPLLPRQRLCAPQRLFCLGMCVGSCVCVVCTCGTGVRLSRWLPDFGQRGRAPLSMCCLVCCCSCSSHPAVGQRQTQRDTISILEFANGEPGEGDPMDLVPRRRNEGTSQPAKTAGGERIAG